MSALSKYALSYIMSILITAFSCDYRGKTVDITRNSDRHRTSISRFLRYEKWNDSALEETMRKLVINIINEESRKSGMPILFIVDDMPIAYNADIRYINLLCTYSLRIFQILNRFIAEPPFNELLTTVHISFKRRFNLCIFFHSLSSVISHSSSCSVKSKQYPFS